MRCGAVAVRDRSREEHGAHRRPEDPPPPHVATEVRRQHRLEPVAIGASVVGRTPKIAPTHTFYTSVHFHYFPGVVQAFPSQGWDVGKVIKTVLKNIELHDTFQAKHDDSQDFPDCPAWEICHPPNRSVPAQAQAPPADVLHEETSGTVLGSDGVSPAMRLCLGSAPSDTTAVRRGWRVVTRTTSERANDDQSPAGEFILTGFLATFPFGT